jgi:hypothetical protein
MHFFFSDDVKFLLKYLETCVVSVPFKVARNVRTSYITFFLFLLFQTIFQVFGIAALPENKVRVRTHTLWSVIAFTIQSIAA